MALPLPPHPDLPAWAERHGLDLDRVVAPLDVQPAPTREHPHQVRVDYVVLLHAGDGVTTARDARTMLTCDPPPTHAEPKGCTCAVRCDTAHVCAEQPQTAWLDATEIRAAAGRYLDTHPREKAELDQLVASVQPTQDDRDIAERLRALVTRGRVFGVAAFTYETLVETLVGPSATGAVPVGYVAGVEAPTWRGPQLGPVIVDETQHWLENKGLIP